MKKIFFCLLALTTMWGCKSEKDILYLQDISDNMTQQDTKGYNTSILPDDLLSIMVNSKDRELTVPFNLPMVSYQMGSNANGISSSQKILGFLVDSEGYIDYPILGKIKVVGLTRSQLKDKIKSELISKGYIKDPIVTIQFLNFKISVLGEVNHPGTFDVNGDRMTIFQALGKAGDLTIYGRRDKVTVIRELQNKRYIATLDLKSSKIFDSPFYYLRQNDIVYVAPNKTKAGQSTINQNKNIGVLASITSVLTSVAILIFK